MQRRKPYSVRYEAVNAMLLNEFLKEHRKNEEQEKTIAELKSGMTALTATVKEQAAQIQKVSAQLKRANLRRKWSTIPKRSISQSAVTLHRLAPCDRLLCFQVSRTHKITAFVPGGNGADGNRAT